MTAPIFQKGEIFKFVEIQEIIEENNHSLSLINKLECYKEGYFKYLGVNDCNDKVLNMTSDIYLDSLNEEIKNKTPNLMIARYGDNLRMFAIKNNSLFYSDILIDSNIDLNDNKNIKEISENIINMHKLFLEKEVK